MTPCAAHALGSPAVGGALVSRRQERPPRDYRDDLPAFFAVR
jgi:hypothetical protein